MAKVTKLKTKFFTSNRSESMTTKVNEFLDTLDEAQVLHIEHDISMSEKRGYMMSCMVYYWEEVDEKDETLFDPDLGCNLDFGIDYNPTIFDL